MAKILFSGFTQAVATRLLLFATIWAASWSVFSSQALFWDQIRPLLVMFMTANLLGELFIMSGLPALLGMMIGGFLLRNVGGGGGDGGGLSVSSSDLSSALRTFALAIILLRAGLGLDPLALRRLSGVCLRLAFLPCLIEAATITLVAHWLLGLPLQWGLMMGFVLGAVSPAVVVPAMLDLTERRLGTDKGIPTLVIAAASVDDVLAITGFGVCISTVFGSSAAERPNVLLDLLRGPLESAVGLVLGGAFGALLWIIPRNSSDMAAAAAAATSSRPPDRSTDQLLRSILVISLGVSFLFGSRALNAAGVGPLACLTVSFTAAVRWRPAGVDEAVVGTLRLLWILAEHFLFVLIGSEVSLDQVLNADLPWLLCCLLVGLVLRILGTVLAVLPQREFNFKEKIFIAVAWIPKATVQAAIGPYALDQALRLSDEENPSKAILVGYSKMLLNVAVLSIMITAPIGAACIALSGPRLLSKSDQEEDSNKRKNNFDLSIELNPSASEKQPSDEALHE